MAFWEDWERRLEEQGAVASDAEIEASVAQVRAERRHGER